MSYKIEDIEDAIVNALKASPLAAIVKTIDSYHGEIDTIIEQVKQLTIPLPAVYVLYAGSDFPETANLSFDDNLTFTVVSIAKDLRGKEKLRAAIYPILDTLKETLIGNNLNLNIEPLKPKRIEATLVTRLFSIYSFDIETSFSMD